MENRKKYFLAFTLAEMMVVLLIMSIVLAAMAPVMTTKMKTDKSIASSSPWKWSNQGVGPHAYFASSRQPIPMAMIGQDNAANDDNGRLIINTQNDYAHILFKHDGNTLARFSIGNPDDHPSFALNTSGNIGNGSVAFGSGALNSNTTGNNNTAIGYQALINEPSHSNNTAIGALSMANNNGQQNTAVGSGALVGSNTVANNTGSDNVAVGYEALLSNTSGSNNVAVGAGALLSNTASSNTAIGTSALRENTSGARNTAVGFNALSNNTTGTSNTAIGHIALSDDTTGYSNTAVGGYSLSYLTTGNSNTAIGASALYNLSTGNSNFAAGDAAGYNTTTGIGNVFVGSSTATSNTTGSYNTVLGLGAMRLNTIGNYNTVLGVSALQKAKTSSNNVAIGYNACANVTTGSNITCIGAGSGPSAARATQSNVVYIGTENQTVYIPGNLVVGKNTILSYDGQNRLWVRELYHKSGWATFSHLGTDYETEDDPVYGENSGHAFGGDRFEYGQGETWSYTGGFTVRSDRRLKYVGSENKSGLDKIKQLKVFNYTFKKDPQKTPRVGVIAQDLQKVFPNAVKTGRDGFLKIRTEDILYALVNAVKEIDVKISEILKQVQNDKTEIKQLKKENAELKARLDKLEQKLK